ncbi:MAG: DUF1684 domain-containing protein [Chloroflexota bacterium]
MTFEPEPDLAYRAAIEAEWAADDDHFRHDPRSPLRPEDREAFEGMPHFPIDESWRLRGLPLEPYAGDAPREFGMAATLGEPRPSIRAGVFRFARGGAEHRLVAYQFIVDGELDEHLFVPFMDATTGTETYGAGRYLDVVAEGDGAWTLDFNRAYHPSCAYNPRYSCPITPPENRLPIRVEAGVKLAEGHAH